MTTYDLLNSQFDLVNDGCVFIDTTQAVTKLNSSARIMFNIDSEKAVGLQITELLGTQNNHLLQVFNKLTLDGRDNPNATKPEHGEKVDKVQLQPTESIVGSYLITNMGADSKQDKKQVKIPINFYCNRLSNEHHQTFGFLMVI